MQKQLLMEDMTIRQEAKTTDQATKNPKQVKPTKAQKDHGAVQQIKHPNPQPLERNSVAPTSDELRQTTTKVIFDAAAMPTFDVPSRSVTRPQLFSASMPINTSNVSTPMDTIPHNELNTLTTDIQNVPDLGLTVPVPVSIPTTNTNVQLSQQIQDTNVEQMPDVHTPPRSSNQLTEPTTNNIHSNTSNMPFQNPEDSGIRSILSILYFPNVLKCIGSVSDSPLLREPLHTAPVTNQMFSNHMHSNSISVQSPEHKQEPPQSIRSKLIELIAQIEESSDHRHKDCHQCRQYVGALEQQVTEYAVYYNALSVNDKVRLAQGYFMLGAKYHEHNCQNSALKHITKALDTFRDCNQMARSVNVDQKENSDCDIAEIDEEDLGHFWPQIVEIYVLGGHVFLQNGQMKESTQMYKCAHNLAVYYGHDKRVGNRKKIQHVVMCEALENLAVVALWNNKVCV